MFCGMQTWQALTRRSWDHRKRSCLAEVRTKEEMLPCMHVCSSVMSDCLWPYGLLVSLSMGFSSQEYWSGLPCPPPGVLLNPGIKPTCLMLHALTSRFFTSSTTWCCHKWHENQKEKKKDGKHHCHLPSSDLSLASHWMNEPTHSLRKVIPCHSNQGRRNLRNRLQANTLTGQPLEKLRAAAVRKVRAIIWGQSV